MIDGVFIYEDKSPLVCFPTNGTDVDDVKRKISEVNIVMQGSDWHAPVEVSPAEALMVRQYGRSILIVPFGTEDSPLMVEELSDRIIIIIESCLKSALTPKLVTENKAQLILILSEMIDTGVPRLTEPNIIEHILYKDGILSQLFAQATVPAATAQTALNRSSQGTQQMPDSLVPWTKPWRRPRVKYNREESFVDIIEHISGVVKSKGYSRPSGLHINGEVHSTSRLSDDPYVVIDMKLPVPITCVQVHAAVDKKRLSETAREYSSLKFGSSPPDAKSRMCKYSLLSGETGPLSVQSNRAKESFEITLSTSIDVKVQHLQDPIITIVFPPSVKSVKESSSTDGDSNVTNPRRCVYRSGKTVPMGWKAHSRAQALSQSDEYIEPLYAEVQYNSQGRIPSTACVNSISITPEKSKPANPPFKGVRYQTFVDSSIIA